MGLLGPMTMNDGVNDGLAKYSLHYVIVLYFYNIKNVLAAHL